MFDRVAGHYDALNSVMTAGLHHRWRERAADAGRAGARRLGPRRLLRHRRPGARAGRPGRPGGHVVGCDFSEPMLDLAREKAAARQAAGRPLRVGRRARSCPTTASASTPSPSASASATSPTSTAACAEMARVLKPGRAPGDPRDHPADPAAALDLLLALVRPHRALCSAPSPATPRPTPTCPSRSAAFPAPAAWPRRWTRAGFERIRYTVLAGGIIAIHSGVRG